MPSRLGRKQLSTICHTPSKRTRAKRFGSAWWATSDHSELTCHYSKWWKTQSDVSPLQKSTPLVKTKKKQLTEGNNNHNTKNNSKTKYLAPTKTTATTTTTEMTESQDPPTHPMRRVGRQTKSQDSAFWTQRSKKLTAQNQAQQKCTQYNAMIVSTLQPYPCFRNATC